MNKEEVKKIMNYIAESYKNSFEITEEKKEYWINELSQYDYEDINNRLKELMSEERYSYQPPLLEAITRGVTKKHNKVDFNELVYYCYFCKRPYNDKNELDIHEDRCSAIRYIERQYKRFKWGALNNSKKIELYNMSEEEFDRKYKMLLRKVQSLTTDDLEKQRIEFIFNPPRQEIAKEFIGG